jgi:hypothetical protein
MILILLALAGFLTFPAGAARGADDPAALVAQLGAKAFADREVAGRALRRQGTRALPAVTAGCASPDAEISRRCKSLLVQLRSDRRAAFAAAFRADRAGKENHEHPAWDRLVALAGDSPAGRTLFAEMIADPDQFARLDDAVADPNRAAALYMEAVRDISARRAELGKFTFHIEVWPGDRPAELAALLYLGTCFSDDPWPAGTDTGTTHLPVYIAGKPLRGPAGGPVAKLFVAWLGQRTDANLLQSGLDVIFCHALADGLPLARRVATDSKLPAATRTAALPVLGRLGTASDASACAVLLTDETLFGSFDTNGYLPRGTAVEKRTVQVRDVAAAVALSLVGADPRAHGFTAADDPTWREYLVSRYEAFASGTMRERRPGTTKAVPKEVLLWPPAHGFKTDADRAAAHAKAAAWLAARPK